MILAPQTPAEVNLALKALGLDAPALSAIARKALYVDLSRPEAMVQARILAEATDQVCIIYRVNPDEGPQKYRVMIGKDASIGQCGRAVDLIEPEFAKEKEKEEEGASVLRKVPATQDEINSALLLWHEQRVDPQVRKLLGQHLRGKGKRSAG